MNSLKIRTTKAIKKQVLLSLHFRIQGKEKQKIHFINANTNKES